MTSASELFHSRRYRLGRTAYDLGFESSPDRYLHFTSNNRRHFHQDRYHFDGGDLPRRSSHVRQLCHRASLGEHVAVRFGLGNDQSISNNNVNAENLSSVNNPRATRNHRLPGDVLLARERLYERLRGSSPSESRLNARASPGIEDSRVVYSRVRRTRITAGRLVGSQGERAQFLQESKQKPPGLTQEALACLHLEVFSSKETRTERQEPILSWDCSICLENFMDGDKLLHLPCGHRFHYACLDPWVRSCGNCPYCRRSIV